MSDVNVRLLVQRLDRLERETRRLKGIGVLALLGLAAVTLMGQAQPKERILEAKALKLTDTNGVTAVLAGDVFRFYKPEGIVRLTLGVGAYGPNVVLSDPNGQVRLVLGAMSLEEPGRPAPERRPESSLILFDKNFRSIWKAP